MSQNTAIEWCDATFNPWWGCTRISPGCDHCYAEHHARRFGVRWGTTEPRRIASEKVWAEPVKWNAQRFFECDCGYRGTLHQLTTNIIHGCGSALRGREVNLRTTRRRVFCASMSDWADGDAPEGARKRMWALIRATPNLDWLLLTKRSGNAERMLPEDWGDGYANVWLGATIVNQAEAERDVPKLLRTPARLRFLSCEPMLGPIDLEKPMPGPDLNQGGGASMCQPWMIQSGIDWVIAGGESGRQARPMHPAWARSLRDQCAAANVPFLLKQWGEWVPDQLVPGGDLGGDLRSGVVRHLHAPGNPEGFFRRGDAYVRRVGKKAAGRVLDGFVHNAFPTIARAA